MAVKELVDLEKVFPQVVATMDVYFDTHDLVRRLGQAHQRLYVLALARYARTDRPFQIVHGEIARRLLRHPELARKVGDHGSRDIFGQSGSAALWQRVV
jgi:hypothetical protein